MNNIPVGSLEHKLDVVIVSYNSEKFIRDCLDSVTAQDVPFQYRIIVVDNASNDNTVSIIRNSFPECECIVNRENNGFAAANNQALNYSNAKFIFFLNPDTRLHKNALTNLVHFLESNREAGIVGPKIFNADGSLQRTGVTFPSLWNLFVEIIFLDLLLPYSNVFGRHKKLYLDPDRVNEVDYLQGSCLLTKRDTLNVVGNFDESFFMYFEETDLCYRVKTNRYKVFYTPDAEITHYGGGGLSYYDKQRLLLFHKSYLVFVEKHYTRFHKAIFVLLLLIRALVRSFVLTLTGLLTHRKRRQYFERGKGYFDVVELLLGLKR